MNALAELPAQIATTEFDYYDGVGSGSIAAIVGMDDNLTPYQLWRHYVDPASRPDLSENEDVQGGIFFEEAIVRGAAFRLRRPYQMRPEDQVLRHHVHTWARARPDAYSIKSAEDRAIIEAKFRHWRMARQYGDEGTDEVLAKETLQVTWQCGIAGYPRGYVAVQLDKKLPRVFTVDFDATLFQYLLDAAGEFWHRYVLHATPPPPLNRADVAARWPQHDPGLTVEVDSANAEKVGVYKDLSARMREIEKQRDALADELAIVCGDAERMEYNGEVIATYRCHERSSVDLKRLRAELSEIARAYTNTKHVRVFLPK